MTSTTMTPAKFRDLAKDAKIEWLIGQASDWIARDGWTPGQVHRFYNYVEMFRKHHDVAESKSDLVAALVAIARNRLANRAA